MLCTSVSLGSLLDPSLTQLVLLQHVMHCWYAKSTPLLHVLILKLLLVAAVQLALSIGADDAQDSVRSSFPSLAVNCLHCKHPNTLTQKDAIYKVPRGEVAPTLPPAVLL